MKYVHVLFLMLIWILPIYLMTKAYLNMDRKEQQAFKSEFKNPLVRFVSGLAIIGLLLFSTGNIMTMEVLQHIGMIMIFICWFTISVISWRRKKIGFITSISLIMSGVIGMFVYRYLI